MSLVTLIVKPDNCVFLYTAYNIITTIGLVHMLTLVCKIGLYRLTNLVRKFSKFVC